MHTNPRGWYTWYKELGGAFCPPVCSWSVHLDSAFVEPQYRLVGAVECKRFCTGLNLGWFGDQFSPKMKKTQP
jgi:hypothetical protein